MLLYMQKYHVQFLASFVRGNVEDPEESLLVKVASGLTQWKAASCAHVWGKSLHVLGTPMWFS